MKTAELDALHERIAVALGWSSADTKSFSLSALQSMVYKNEKDPKLYSVIADIRASGRHLVVDDPVERWRP
jgi:hypothetical protein